MNLGKFYVWWIASVAALGGLLFGYDWVVIGGAKPFYEAHFGLATPAIQGWAMSCALAGCLVGALLSGVLSERFGRKPALLAAALVFPVSSVGTGTARTFMAFVLWRMSIRPFEMGHPDRVTRKIFIATEGGEGFSI